MERLDRAHDWRVIAGCFGYQVHSPSYLGARFRDQRSILSDDARQISFRSPNLKSRNSAIAYSAFTPAIFTTLP